MGTISKESSLEPTILDEFFEDRCAELPVNLSDHLQPVISISNVDIQFVNQNVVIGTTEDSLELLIVMEIEGLDISSRSGRDIDDNDFRIGRSE